MPKIEIAMTEEEKLTLQFRLFEYNGLRVNVDNFLHSGREYTEECGDRLISTLLEKYSALQICLYKILEAHGYRRTPVKTFDFFLNDSSLTIQT
jgi:hypothetical protein